MTKIIIYFQNGDTLYIDTVTKFESISNCIHIRTKELHEFMFNLDIIAGYEISVSDHITVARDE